MHSTGKRGHQRQRREASVETITPAACLCFRQCLGLDALDRKTRSPAPAQLVFYAFWKLALCYNSDEWLQETDIHPVFSMTLRQEGCIAEGWGVGMH